MPRRSTVRFFAAFIGAAVAAGFATSLAAAEPVFPPGMRIGLEPPAGMSLSKTFPGFEDLEHKAAINILDLPGEAYEDLEKRAFNKETQDVIAEKREMFSFHNGIGFLIIGRAKTDTPDVRRWLLLASVSEGALGRVAALINVQIPDAARDIYPEAKIRAALASVTFRPLPLMERVNLLPFKIGELSGFRYLQVMPAGVILTDGPGEDMTKQPYVIVHVGTGPPIEPSDRDRFARELLNSSPVGDLTVLSSEPQRIGGYPGHEIRAQGKDPAGNSVALVQWIRFGSGGFMRIIGVGHNDEWEKLYPRLRAIRDGVTPK